MVSEQTTTTFRPDATGEKAERFREHMAKPNNDEIGGRMVPPHLVPALEAFFVSMKEPDAVGYCHGCDGLRMREHQCKHPITKEPITGNEESRWVM